LPKRRTLIIGSGMAAVLVAEKIERHPEYGLGVVGFVDEGPRKSVRGRREPLLGGIAELSDIIERESAELVILGYTVNNTKDILGALYHVEPKVEVLMLPRYFEFVSAGMKVDDLVGIPMLRLNRRRPTGPERTAKRAEDLILGGLFSLLVLPLVPLVALAIKLDSPGPVFFKHERVGKNGRPFYLYKFRSMRVDADHDGEALSKLADEDPRSLKNRQDGRITRVGAFLRKYSIDELPQFYNVLKGDMSLVGPRPSVATEVEAYEEWQRKRLSVPPGITGIWQTHGRSDLPFDERVWLDFMYIDSWSVGLDLRIILQTIPAVISTEGAY
jgi:exopolysaccharide biosynthesis polyprenyl glycosylphosphotransferase